MILPARGLAFMPGQRTTALPLLAVNILLMRCLAFR